MDHTFQTNNLTLAAALITLGAEPAKLDTGEEYLILNLYDPASLQRVRDEAGNFRYKGRGMSIIKCARDAVKRGIPGNVFYNFERSAEADEVIDAFNKQKELTVAMEGGDPGRQEAGQIECSRKDAARIIAQFKHAENKLKDGWNSAPACVAVPGETHTEKAADGAMVTVGSKKIISLNASPETFARLGLTYE